MPRNGSDIYFIPPGTEGFPDTTIESEKYNNYIHDVETDLNRPRPISAGGTGADDADEALANLGAEKSSQRVLNYDSHVFMPGSFYSLIGATGAPPASLGQTATHAFVGWVVSSDIPATPAVNQNVVVHARNQNDVTVPGRIYVREKKAGTWGPWSQDNTGVMGPAPPVNPPDGLLWWNSTDGQLYVYYKDIDTSQWVIASPSPDPAQFLLKAGDTMIGTLGLAVPPTADMHAANKKYVDDADAAALNSKLDKAGGTVTGTLTLVGSYPALVLNKIPGVTANAVVGASSGVPRWAMLIGDYADETGSNVGSNFRLQRYNDFGTYLGTPIAVDRQTGDTTTGRLVVASLHCSGSIYSAVDISTARDIVAGSNGWKPGGGLWGDGSDIRTKNVEGEYTAGLDAVAQLRPVVYTFKGNETDELPSGDTVPYSNSPHHVAATDKTKYHGLIAQEVETIFPEMVTKKAGYIDGTAVTDLRYLNSTALIYALVNSVKELKARIEALEGA